jgi:hypothetical protein
MIRYPDYLYYREHNTTFTELASHFNSGVALADTERSEELDAHVVSANYFSALGVSPHVGRFFRSDEDVAPGRNPVIVLSHSFWQRRFGADPGCVRPYEVIGVAQYRGVRPGGAAPGASLFRADWTSAVASGRMLVRVKADARTMLPLLRQEIVAVDPRVAISEALPLSGLVENWYAEVPLAMRVVGYAGGLGLLLTAIGLYGVLALAVGQRTREIGIRMALGARVPSILHLVLREGIALALTGLALGLASAIVLSRLLTRFLYGVTPTDPVAYGVATVLVGGVALAACTLPAWRAAKVDPIVALRHE